MIKILMLLVIIEYIVFLPLEFIGSSKNNCNFTRILFITQQYRGSTILFIYVDSDFDGAVSSRLSQFESIFGLGQRESVRYQRLHIDSALIPKLIRNYIILGHVIFVPEATRARALG